MTTPFEPNLRDGTLRCRAQLDGEQCIKADLHNRSEEYPIHRSNLRSWSTGFADKIASMAEQAGVKLGQWQVQALAAFDHKPEPSAEQRLAQWWRDAAEAEIEQTVAKAIEYGSTDLIDIGRSIARIAGRDVEDDEAAEMGIFFYLEGKLSRWRSALERGDRPSLDTLLDIGVYARMAQRVRAYGGWPGVEPVEPFYSDSAPPQIIADALTTFKFVPSNKEQN